MKFRDLLRTGVLATNRYWPFSSLNKLPYAVAIQSFVRLCSSYPAIKSVSLRAGLVERQWVPGLSDIDFTIVLDGTLSNEEQLIFLRDFWRRFTMLKRRFPMIGEVDILNDSHIASWARFGLPGHSTRHWRLLHGIETVSSAPFDPSWFAEDCIDYALNYFYWYSRGFFERKFYGNAEPSYLLDQDLRRLASKSLRCLERISTRNRIEDRSLEHCSEPVLFARVLTELQKQISVVTNANINDPGDISWDSQWAVERQAAHTHQNIVDAGIFAPWTGVIESVTLDFNNRIYVVVKDDLNVSEIARCVANLQPNLNQAGQTISLLSRTVFTYLLRHYQPFEYLHLLRHRKLVFGNDLVLQLVPPSKAACARFVVNQVPNVVAFPYSRSFHNNPNTNELASLVERGLFARVYLDNHIVAPTPEKLLSVCQPRYPNLVRVLQEYRSQNAYREPDHEFETFKDLADGLCSALENVAQ